MVNGSTMKVQLSFHAKKLRNVAGAFKGISDPYAVVTLLSSEHGEKPTVLGKTEIIKNTLSPDWTKYFVLDFELGKPMNVNVSIYDEVRKGENKPMGSAIFDIGAVLGAKGNVLGKKLKGGGTLIARVEKSMGTGKLKLRMHGHKLENTEGFLRKSDPFYELMSKDLTAHNTTDWNNVYRSEFVKDNLSPYWKEHEVELSILCDGNLEQGIQVVIYDYEKSGKHVHMGTFETTVNELVSKKGETFQIVRGGKTRGKIIIDDAEIIGRHQPSSGGVVEAMSEVTISDAPVVTPSKPHFVDYISGGCELNLCVAIDFTGSNGDPRRPGTLHHIDPYGRSRNDYEKVILSLGTILGNYDSDQKYPVWGFGAKYGGIVRHCFQCGPTREVKGVNGVLNAYHEVFASGLTMSGPTVFEEVIKVSAAQAISAQNAAMERNEQIYTILLIISDGSVTDIRSTVAALDEVSEAPLSIIVIGVGNADFGGMRFVDDHRRTSKRDILQFVEFNRYSHSVPAFTKEALCELPDQLVGYFTKHGIMPLAPVHKDDDEIAVLPYNEEEEIDLSLEFGDDDEVVVSGGGGYHSPY